MEGEYTFEYVGGPNDGATGLLNVPWNRIWAESANKKLAARGVHLVYDLMHQMNGVIKYHFSGYSEGIGAPMKR